MTDLIDRTEALAKVDEIIGQYASYKTWVVRSELETIPSVEAIPIVTILAEADRQEKIGYTQTADVLRRLADPDQCDGNWRADK